MRGSPTVENACGTSAERLGRSTPSSWDLVGTFKCNENLESTSLFISYTMMTCPFRVKLFLRFGLPRRFCRPKPYYYWPVTASDMSIIQAITVCLPLHLRPHYQWVGLNTLV